MWHIHLPQINTNVPRAQSIMINWLINTQTFQELNQPTSSQIYSGKFLSEDNKCHLSNWPPCYGYTFRALPPFASATRSDLMHLSSHPMSLPLISHKSKCIYLLTLSSEDSVKWNHHCSVPFLFFHPCTSFFLDSILLAICFKFYLGMISLSHTCVCM